jgi:hypothetical protein
MNQLFFFPILDSSKKETATGASPLICVITIKLSNERGGKKRTDHFR